MGGYAKLRSLGEAANSTSQNRDVGHPALLAGDANTSFVIFRQPLRGLRISLQLSQDFAALRPGLISVLPPGASFQIETCAPTMTFEGLRALTKRPSFRSENWAFAFRMESDQ